MSSRGVVSFIVTHQEIEGRFVLVDCRKAANLLQKSIVRLIIVDHGSGFYTLYGNLDEMTAQVGAEVTAGTRIGTASDYLHFEIRKDGKAVNPLDWLKP